MLNTYIPLIFACMALFFLSIGIRVTLSKKPLLFPSKVFFVFMAVALSPQYFMLIDSALTREHFGLDSFLLPLMFAVLMVFIWIQMKGYTAIGISDDSFRNALHYALRKSGIEFEEQLSTIKLKNMKAELQVAVQGWTGTGLLKLKKSTNKAVLSQLIAGMNEYYNAHSVPINYLTSIFYLIIGFFILAFAGYFHLTAY